MRNTFLNLLIISFAFIGLTLISLGLIPTLQNGISHSSQSNFLISKSDSTKILNIEFKLLNQEISKDIFDSINGLQNQFAKDYLTAVYNKRNKSFDKSFNTLIAYLKNKPKHFKFYEELVAVSNLSGKFDLLKKQISEVKDSSDIYIKYLKALISYNQNKYVDVISLLSGNENIESLLLLSYAYRGKGDFNYALVILESIKKKLNTNSINLDKILISQGSLYFLSGDYEKAEQFYHAGLNEAVKNQNSREQAKANINLGIIDDQNGEYDSARSKYKSALKFAEDIEDIDLQGTVLSELGVSYSYTNNLVEAKNTYEKSYKILKVINNKEKLSNLSANIASIFSQLYNYPVSISYYKKGLDFAGENINSKIINLRGIGDVYANLSNYSKALEYYNKAKENSASIKNVDLESSVDMSIGTLYFNINKPEKALETFLKVEERSNQISDPYLMEDLKFKIGLCYTDLKNYKLAKEFYGNGLLISQTQQDIYYQILISGELAYSEYLNNNNVEAKKILIKSINQSNDYGYTQLSSVQNRYLGQILENENQIEQAKNHFIKAIDLAKQSKDFNNEIQSYYLLGKLYSNQSNTEKAKEYFITAIEKLEKLSEYLISNSEIQMSHFSGFKEAYSELANIYLTERNNEKAFEIIERSRSRNTFQNLVNLKILESLKDENSLTEYYDLKWSLDYGNYSDSELAKKKLEFEKLNEKIFSAFGIKEISQNHSSNITISELQKSLEKKENYISVYINDNNLYLFVVNKNQFTTDKIDLTRNDIIKLIKKIGPIFDEQSSTKDIYLNQDLFSFNSDASYELYDKIFKETFTKIPKDNNVIFSLPSELILVPLEFLVTSKQKDDSPYYYTNKKFLVEDYPISYIPSASVFIQQKVDLKKNNNKILLVGDPQINKNDFALSYRGGLLESESFNSRSLMLFPLRYSKEEVENVSDLVSDTKILLSDEATEENFKAEATESQVIHLSTHSFLHNDKPFIIFSKNQSNVEDGFLEMSEILNLKLAADLVVLSSCRSGLGNIDEAEGIIGMQKSFYEAGAKSIVVSLWDVNDKYTSLFMKSFYNYLSQGYDKSEALQKAKIYFKNNYSSNPYYWAAFVLSGNISKLELGKPVNYSLFILLGIIAAMIILSSILYKRFYIRKIA